MPPMWLTGHGLLKACCLRFQISRVTVFQKPGGVCLFDYVFRWRVQKYVLSASRVVSLVSSFFQFAREIEKTGSWAMPAAWLA